MYTLHIANKNYSSWSLRPWILMKVLGIPFTESLHVFEEAGNRDAFRQFSPAGTVPCLWDGDTRVWESLAIIEYLAERHDGVWPDAPEARAWARCASAEMHASFGALRTVCSLNCGLRIALHEIPPSLAKDLRRLEELWGQGLDRFGGPFLAGGAFTAVDAFFAPVAFRVRTFALALSGPAHAYAERLLALPAMQDWYDAALAEPWRDEPHDRELLKFGRIIGDHRTPA